MKYCDDCKNLHPKEYEQTDKKEDHFCDAYNQILYHFDYHPHILRLSYCIYYISPHLTHRIYQFVISKIKIFI